MQSESFTRSGGFHHLFWALSIREYDHRKLTAFDKEESLYMQNPKCDCGHVNPFGTAICESCGKELIDSDQALYDMRYEGVARKSQVYRRSIIDHIWQFFSSVKVGIWLIIATLVAAAIGTILPQSNTVTSTLPLDQFYQNEYGWFGSVYYTLGLDDLYGSWWFMLIICLLGASLVICSIDRVFPLYRALKNQRVTKHDQFMRKQRLFSEQETALAESEINLIQARLVSRHYHVRREGDNLFAEKGRFSRWGPYINHIGLIIFLLGCLFRQFPGINVTEHLSLMQGETQEIPGTNGEYFLKNNQFTIKLYGDQKDKQQYADILKEKSDIVKQYETDVTLYQMQGDGNLKAVKDYPINVNKPLKFADYQLYQMSYRTTDTLENMSFSLVDKQSEQTFGEIKIDLQNPEKDYSLPNGYTVQLIGYYPDFYINESGAPATKSDQPNNPIFIFNMSSPQVPAGEKSIVGIMQTVETSQDGNTLAMKFSNASYEVAPILTLRKDQSIWILALGGLIFMIGVVQGSYWQHRRIWLKGSKDHLLVASHTNKNWLGQLKDIERAFEGLPITVPKDQLKQ